MQFDHLGIEKAAALAELRAALMAWEETGSLIELYAAHRWLSILVELCKEHAPVDATPP